MSVHFKRFYKQSQRSHEKFDDEISRRSAMSRGYYFVFHLIRECFRSHSKAKFGENDNESDHKKAKKFLEKTNNRQLAKQYYYLHERRKTADYDIDDNISERKINKFYDNLDKLLKGLRNDEDLRNYLPVDDFFDSF